MDFSGKIAVAGRVTRKGAEVPAQPCTRPGPVTNICHRRIGERLVNLLHNLDTRCGVTIYASTGTAVPIREKDLLNLVRTSYHTGGFR